MLTNQSFQTERKALLIGKNAQVDAILKDISIKNAGVITPRGAREGTELELEFELPAMGEFITLSIATEVVHRHNVNDDIYLKLKFKPLSTSQHNAIQDFLNYKQRLRDLGKKPEFD